MGGFGRVGIEVTRYLLKHTSYLITLASREARILPSDIPDRERISRCQLDAVNDPKGLESFCQSVDLIISCIGPSGIIGDRVAKICKKTATPLVDAGGYDLVLNSLEHDEKNKPSPVPLIINVGLLPGLSGMFPKYVLDTSAEGRNIESMDVQYVGRDAWSYNSAWDIINGLGDFGDEKGFCYWQGQKIVNVSMLKAGNKAHFPAPIGSISTMLLYAEEIVRLAKSYNIQTARVFGANIGRRATFICLIAKLFKMYKSSSGIHRAANWLVKASKKDMRKLQPAYGIQVDVSYQSGERVRGQITLVDTYEATGSIIGIAAHCFLENPSIVMGYICYMRPLIPSCLCQQLEASSLLTLKHIDKESNLEFKTTQESQ
ncbi:saccharopine dehydrogenase NADP-binding domain-containing protein [Psychromonas hadalis]|uniref:saccharopine dehydrogenase NADP-binding domain-containing protein n=1 Tax=Psychromonas hadalis TaxID=211669 RepID=UPI0003B6FC48|nr:saccharopine dehydrogenase NADP-binding domain-containing protein [Psychromonas hadalis]